MPSPIAITARHFAKRAPIERYSESRSLRPSRPSVTVSPGAPARGFAPLSTLMPGMTPFSLSSFTKGLPSAVLCRIVSSNRITPLM